jgi:hypothetical protein
LWLRFSFGTLLIGAVSLFALGLLRQLWFGESAYRSKERLRDEHFIQEREFARALLFKRGDEQSTAPNRA